MQKTFEDLDEDFGSPITARALYTPLAVLYAFLPLGLVLGVCRVSAGARMFAEAAPLRIVLTLLAYAAAVHLFLVWPITQWFYPNTERKWHPVARAATVFCSVSAPIYFFAYYLAVPGAHFDWGGVAAAALPPCLLAAIFYEYTRAEWIFSLLLGVGTYLPLFLFADTLGPIIPFWNYSAASSAFYPLRDACIVASIALAFWNTRKRLR